MVIFFSLLITLSLISIFLIYFIIIEGWKIIPPEQTPAKHFPLFSRLFIFLFAIFAISACISFHLGKKFVSPLNSLKKMTSEVAKGNFE